MDVLCQYGIIWIKTDKSLSLTNKAHIHRYIHTYIQHLANYSKIIIVVLTPPRRGLILDTCLWGWGFSAIL